MEKDVAMQVRCIYCLREQYAPTVWEISHGRHPCVWCGKTPPIMIQKEWVLKLKRAKEKEVSNEQ